ncbi:MAG: thioredoxin domain-containing protein [Candidatus Azobacteroides sp.]|nr:thioredoxin domain-containing protein [Candidatus Azobacteroides sp.]
MRNVGKNVFGTFLSLLKVKHTHQFSDKYFNEHPHKYNLFGISKMLSDYGVRNAGTRIKNKERDLFNIETPFIAHFGSEFVVVCKIKQDKVHYFWNGKKIVLSVSSFIEAWSGVVLLAETSPDSIEPDYKAHKREEVFGSAQKTLLFAAIGLVLLFASINNALFRNIGLTLLSFLNLAGVYVGYLLVLKQMHVQSRYVDKICTLFSKSDCNNVLESDAAKFRGVFGWSEIGLGYFTANVLMIVFLPQFVSYMALINCCTLPYAFWSVWYQKTKARQWCPLCLMVQVLLWGIFAVDLFFGLIQIPSFERDVLFEITLIVCIYVVCILFFNLLIPKLGKGKQLSELNREINSLKADENVFISLWKQQPKYEVSKADSQILFGNPEALLCISILTNPFCNPCAKMHKRVEQFLKETDNKVCIQYLFSSFGPDLDFAGKYLIAARLEKEQSEFERIIADWFEKGPPMREAFFAGLQLDVTNPAVEAEFQKHEAWKAKTQLQATPTILVNGRQLPGNYKIEDLRYFTGLEINVD